MNYYFINQFNLSMKSIIISLINQFNLFNKKKYLN